MNARYLTIFLFLVFILSACSVSLAGDITPPPGYKSPTPPPAIGPLYPSSPPSLARGEDIYFVECVSCHGEKGLGNGPLAGGLPVPVVAIGLPEISRHATPAEWFTILSRGRTDRSMPSFASLTPEQRWDVIAFVYSMSTSPKELQLGADLYAERCATCHGIGGVIGDPDAPQLPAPPVNLSDLEFMSAATGIGLFRAISEGVDSSMPEFGSSLTEIDIWALVAYLRSLTFDLTTQTGASEPSPTTEQAMGTPTPTDAVLVTPDLSLGDSPAATTVVRMTGSISGTIVHGSDGDLPEELNVTLRGFDHGQDMDNPWLEVVNLSGTAQSDGSFAFEDVEMPVGRFFLAEVEYAGVPYQSDPVSVDAGFDQLSLSPVVIFEATSDLDALNLAQVHIAFDFSVPEELQVFEIYVLTNPGDMTVAVPTEAQALPFIRLPEGAEGVGFGLAEDSAPILPSSLGIAFLPGDQQYGIIASFTLPYDKKLELVQPFILPVASVSFFVPEGVKLQNPALVDAGLQPIQGDNYHMYSAENLPAGSSLTLTISGRPKATSESSSDTRSGLVIGLGVFGVVLIMAGVYFFIRERSQGAEEEIEESEEDSLGDDPEALMDAIIALDAQFKAGSISKEAYEHRRAELKTRLKELV